MLTGPLFKCFGSKWLSSKKMPKPIHNQIIDIFAGGAGYCLRHADKKVILCESNPHLFQLWIWLIKEASKQEIMDIPLNIPEGTDIRTLGLSQGQQLLLKNWQRTNNVGDCWTISPWGNKPGQWTENTRARVANEFEAIRHWEIYNDGFKMLESYADIATWFIDPPYQYNYKYKSALIDYNKLAKLILEKKGQKIVCEAVDPKTGNIPDWLPFKHFGERITSRRKIENNHHSKELIWIE